LVDPSPTIPTTAATACWAKGQYYNADSRLSLYCSQMRSIQRLTDAEHPPTAGADQGPETGEQFLSQLLFALRPHQMRMENISIIDSSLALTRADQFQAAVG